MYICGGANLFKTNGIGTIARDVAYNFLQQQSSYTIIEGQNENGTYHITKEMLTYGIEYCNLQLPMSDHVFEDAAKKGFAYGSFLACDENGRVQAVLQHKNTYYSHPYRYEGGLDLEFLDGFDCMILYDVNEYSIELYKRAVPQWRGKQVVLVGALWKIFMPYLTSYTDKEVKLLDEMKAENLAQILQSCEKPIHIKDFYPKNEGLERITDGLYCYDEVMILTFMFSYEFSAGNKNPNKKFFLIDGYFKIEGIFGIWQKAFALARYAKKKGYIPAFEIVSSDDNMYSDGEGDDIWNKFFLQPEGYTIEEIHKSKSLTVSPNTNILNVLRYIVESYAGVETQLNWTHGIFNKAVREYCKKQREKLLLDPAHTLGVLIRGTDYVKGNMPGHAIHASVEQMIEKIEEARREWNCNYRFIYLATEDAEICEQMKAQYGEMLVCTDQERFTTKENQLLFELHDEKKQGEGFRLGVEYLATLNLLAQCESLIASGGCNGVTEAMRQNEGAYKNVFIFDNGINARL